MTMLDKFKRVLISQRDFYNFTGSALEDFSDLSHLPCEDTQQSPIRAEVIKTSVDAVPAIKNTDVAML